jgi:hypothetical protein
MQAAIRNKRRERDRFHLKRDLVPGFTWPHDLVRKACNFSGSCAFDVTA